MRLDGAQSRGYNATEAGRVNASPYQQNPFGKNKPFAIEITGQLRLLQRYGLRTG